MDDGGYVLLGFIIGLVPMFFYVNAYGNGWRPKRERELLEQQENNNGKKNKNKKDEKIEINSPLTSIFAIMLGVIDGFKDDK